MKTLSPTFRVREGAEAGRRAAPRSADDDGFFAFVPAADPVLAVASGRVRWEAASGEQDGSAAAAAFIAGAGSFFVGDVASATLGVSAA